MKIAFLGDSITFGYALDDTNDKYSTRVCENLGAEEINFGITGTLMAKAGPNRENDKSFLDRVSLIKDADIAVIFGGTNDYFWSDAPIGNRNDNIECFYRAVTEICKWCCENRDTSKTLIVTPYPHNGIGNYEGGSCWNDSSTHDTTEKNYNGHTLQDYVDVLLEVGKKHNIPTLDLHSAEGFDWKKHTLDGCHPNPDGHKWIAEKICNKIKKIF